MRNMCSWQHVKDNLSKFDPSSRGKMALFVFTMERIVGAMNGRGRTKNCAVLNIHIRMIPPGFCNTHCILVFPFVYYRQFQVSWRKIDSSLDTICNLTYLLLVFQQVSITACYLSMCIAVSLIYLFRLLLFSFSSPFKKHVAIWSRSFISPISVKKYVSCATINFH